MIIWIASYPKSGNTWVRAFLATYMFSEDLNFSFKNLEKINQFPLLKNFTDIGTNPKDLLESSKNWIPAQEWLNLSNKTIFLKTHSSICTINKNNFTNKENTLGAIYLVRDPRDVLVSYAKHDDSTLDYSLQSMINSTNLGTLKDDEKNRFLYMIGSWSENYNSWKNFNLTKKIIIKYEDLLKNSYENLLKIIKYLNDMCGLNVDEKRIQKVNELTNFSNLQSMEKKYGFSERLSKKEMFFRNGKVGEWKNILSKKQSNLIEKTFEKEMLELGYL